jgi:glycosyltransferase involved in cell wall biosynthesis
MKISFIQPSRNNLKYLKWAYNGIRKNQGDHEVEICVADDFSNDGTWEWCQKRMKEDSHFKAIRNEGPTRLGHTILYDRLINEVATHDIAMIYHADMYLCPGALDAIEKYIQPRKIVSLTRIEPPLHPPGPEKILRNFGTEPEDFPEEGFLEWFAKEQVRLVDKTTEGIFAPWAFYREDFQKIGGHDPLYAPQSKEDSDIFNRFMLDGVSFVQTWEGCVYHMTCRGSRYNPTITTVGKESDEWLKQNERSTRNFIRKWGHFVQHDPLMKPVIAPKYNIGIILDAGRSNLLTLLEPWCDTIYIKNYDLIASEYITREQPNTSYSLSERIKPYDNEKNCEILLEVDGDVFMSEDFQIIQQLPQIIKQYGEPGRFQLGNMVVEIVQMNEYQNSLINLKTNG